MRSQSTDGRAYVKCLGYLTLLVGSLTWVGGTSAATPPPPEDVPAVSAYVELVPTSGGSRSPGVGAGGTTRLPAEVEAQLANEGGRDAAALKEIATSRAYGAPPAAPRRRTARPSRPAAPPGDETPLAAGVSVATSGGDERLVVLGASLLVLTVGLAGAAAYRRNRSRLAAG